MIITISKENYLKTIAEAESEGETVIAATLARWLQISPPAVTAGIRALEARWTWSAWPKMEESS